MDDSTIGADPSTAQTLAPHHLGQLTASSIHPDVINARGYQSLQGTPGYEALRAQGFTTGQATNTPGLLLPVWGTDGRRTALSVYRPDTPRQDSKEHPRKYELPRNRAMRLDVPPLCHPRLSNPASTLVITEGQKKADAVASLGLEIGVIAVLGVDCWRGKNAHGGSMALPDWDLVALNQRRVLLVYDSDLQVKTPVRNAMRRLANFLKGKQADVMTCYLPCAPDGTKQGIDDWLTAGHTWEEALQHLGSPWDGAPDPESLSALATKDHLPKIQLDPGQLDVIAHHAQEAILTYQAQHGPQLWQHAGSLCFVSHDLASPQWLKRPAAVPRLQIAPPSKLRGYLCHVASWWRFDGRKGTYTPADPPDNVVKLLLDYGEWKIPPLTGIATRPFLRPDLTLCQEEGYDQASGVLLSGTQTPLTVPHPLTLEAAQTAWSALQALWQDFPFAEARDEAATLAALLTLIARPAIAGCTPLFAFVSSTPGSGKGLLTDVLSLIASGEEATRWRVGHDPEELRKQLDSIALAGEPLAVIDNLTVLGSDALDGTITAKTVSLRRLGTQTTVHVPWRTVLFATGNNLTYRGDTARRVVQITLEPQEEKPDQRTDFVHPELRKHVREADRIYLAHACTILLAYVAAGAPPPQAGYGSFEEWNTLVRGCVVWTTGIDPLAEQEKHITEDEDITAWRQLLHAWQICLGEQRRTLAQVEQEILEVERIAQRQTQPNYRFSESEERIDENTIENWRHLQKSLAALDNKGDGHRISLRHVGIAFRLYKNRIFNKTRMVQAGIAHSVIEWKVQTVP